MESKTIKRYEIPNNELLALVDANIDIKKCTIWHSTIKECLVIEVSE